MVFEVGGFENPFRSGRGRDSLSDRAIEKRLKKWANGRAVFRMPETTDEQLDHLNIARTPEQQQALDIALLGVLADLADSNSFAERMRRAEKFDRVSEFQLFRDAVASYKAGRLKRKVFEGEFVGEATFYAFKVSENMSEKADAPVYVSENDDGCREIRMYLSPEGLPAVSSTEQDGDLVLSEGRGVTFLRLQGELKCQLAISARNEQEEVFVQLPPDKK